MHGLATVEPDDIEVARYFVYGLLGADYDKSPYTQTGERVARLAAGGIRLVIGDLRTDVTKTRKDGSRGRLRIDYGDHRARKPPSTGCGSSSTAPTPPASSTAARSSSSPPNNTPAASSSPAASASPRPAGPRTRTSPPRPCASSAARTCRRR
jgi:hypothetical protein